jgi:hypothetical protein
MLAAYITWHLRDVLAPLTYTDEHIPHRADPVSPAQRSSNAKTKDANKKTPDGLPVRSFRDLLEHLSTLNRETINFTGQRIEKITSTTPTQRRVFELIGRTHPPDPHRHVTTNTGPTHAKPAAHSHAHPRRSSKFGLVRSMTIELPPASHLASGWFSTPWPGYEVASGPICSRCAPPPRRSRTTGGRLRAVEAVSSTVFW